MSALPAIGTDIVHIPAFSEQLRHPGSRFNRVFTPIENRAARNKTNPEQSLAGRWAAKEAFIKAWSQALYGQPPLIPEEKLNWADIEIRPDQWGRPGVFLFGEVAAAVAASLGSEVRFSVSISHDGDYATATCLIS